ncbi:DUF1203 domain-containing protein [Micromonospora sp. NPDC020750]|uniref:DUF1203 domain-containing protein n=1 Tax=unclassified Micromonospora TaxID=2617518 RepID=UPI003790DC24
MTTTPAFRVRALPPEVPAAVRATDRDASGLPPHRSTAVGGEPLIVELLADPAVQRLHSRNVAYGCFMFTVDRLG